MTQPYQPPCQDSRVRAEPCPRETGTEQPQATKRLVLAACILASSMAMIDGSALTVALPALRDDLNGNLFVLQWVLNGYVLALAALTMVGGALADTHGRARVLALGCMAFAGASAICALAPSGEALIAGRILQGIAAAIVTPASLALIGETFPKDERSSAIGTWAAVSALTTAGGPILGGWLVEISGWRAIFWINLPIAALSLLLLSRVPTTGLRSTKPFDRVGAMLLTLTLSLFAYALSCLSPGEGHIDGPEAAGAIWPALISGVLACVFALAFLRSQRSSAHPLIPGYIFQNRTFTVLNTATVAIYVGLSIMFFLLPFDLIERRDLSATQAGMAFLPFTLTVGVLSSKFGKLADRIGARPLLIIGSLLAALGYSALALLQTASLWLGVLAPMTLIGLGFAILVAPLTASVMSSVDDHDEGLASGINNTASRIAQMLGVALAAIFAGLAAGYTSGLMVASVFGLIGAAIVALGFKDPQHS